MCVAGWDAAGAAVGAGLRRGAHQVWGAFLWRFTRKRQVLRPASALAYSPPLCGVICWWWLQCWSADFSF